MNYELYKNDALYGYGENLTNPDKIFINQAQDGFEPLTPTTTALLPATSVV